MMSHTEMSKLITFTLINTNYCEQKSCINTVIKTIVFQGYHYGA